MKILHVISGLQKAAGTSVFCGEVCNGVVAIGHDVTIAVVNPVSHDCYPVDSRIRLISISSILITNHQLLATNHYDLIHIHALWEPILHKIARWAIRNQIPIVWSPHGMLTHWAMNNKKWKKLLAWWLYQRRDLQKASLIHTTAQSEVEDVRRMGLKNRVIVAPLGVNVDDRVERVERCRVESEGVREWGSLSRVGALDGKKTLLFVSRVQRKKGLVNLVKAWREVKEWGREGVKEWKVRIVGPDQEGHAAELRALCEELGVSEDFEFVGPKYGDELQREYASADLFVLPTHSENFGSVVVEALAHEVPVICTKGAPWQELEERGCGWWIDIGVEPLAEALKIALFARCESLVEMGVRGRKLVEEKYTWGAVVKTVIDGYKKIVRARG